LLGTVLTVYDIQGVCEYA